MPCRRRASRSRARSRLRTAAIGAALALFAALPATAAAAGSPYVALGDSFTAGSGVLPPAAGAPLDCTQSARNYPHLTAQALGLSLIDRSCGGAQTKDMTASQFPDQPPQFDALNASTRVVTLGIGGNDNNLFISAIALCGATDAADVANIGAPCKQTFGDYFNRQIAADAPNIAQALQQLRARAPAARVFVVGYPDILPQSGNCYLRLPLTTGDVAYLDGVERNLNAMLRTQAAANGATFIDTYDNSIGHDACKPESVRWVEPLLPGGGALAPVHPNAAGEAATAGVVQAALRGAGIS
jgi:lysophospholipase L1-like esterase